MPTFGKAEIEIKIAALSTDRDAARQELYKIFEDMDDVIKEAQSKISGAASIDSLQKTLNEAQSKTQDLSFKAVDAIQRYGFSGVSVHVYKALLPFEEKPIEREDLAEEKLQECG